ncbi:hypothetical protein GCM10008904_10300 [Paraclostridium ghonii]|uniref:Uncharacterized protein n=1 Tax=Paraclostridium ghonii TaxID=29358 RepID=A0ABU0MYK6_9FIRM|nr:hypothetical protein [Paeniclostridium ghonii]MDQ0555941.1 hypothetical protein [Paeniclostridium ghonii]
MKKRYYTLAYIIFLVLFLFKPFKIPQSFNSIIKGNVKNISKIDIRYKEANSDDGVLRVNNNNVDIKNLLNLLEKHKYIKINPSKKDFKDIESSDLYAISFYEEDKNEEIFSVYIQGDEYIAVDKEDNFRRYKVYKDEFNISELSDILKNSK